MAEISDDALREVTDQIRDLHNLIEVYDTEYDLGEEVVKTLRSKLEKLAETLGLETL